MTDTIKLKMKEFANEMAKQNMGVSMKHGSNNNAMTFLVAIFYNTCNTNFTVAEFNRVQ